jgi:hypothetical protein
MAGSNFTTSFSGASSHLQILTRSSYGKPMYCANSMETKQSGRTGHIKKGKKKKHRLRAAVYR